MNHQNEELRKTTSLVENTELAGAGEALTWLSGDHSSTTVKVCMALFAFG